ncbi:MAG: hypothetical protein GY847_01660 [Proteobacteria bacterium]|nr:hypothetical protein [Pseudomonadota bacterium]
MGRLQRSQKGRMMSHVSRIEVTITDLEAVRDMCKAKGWIFAEGQKTYKWFGRYVGDYPMPEGVTTEELGTCDHAIIIPGCDYEVGLLKKEGKYIPLYDFYDQKIKAALGENGAPIVQGYTLSKIKREAKAKGYKVVEKKRGMLRRFFSKDKEEKAGVQITIKARR